MGGEGEGVRKLRRRTLWDKDEGAIGIEYIVGSSRGNKEGRKEKNVQENGLKSGWNWRKRERGCKAEGRERWKESAKGMDGENKPVGVKEEAKILEK